MEFSHIPVMLDSCIQALNIRPDGIYLDGTMGGGGHSFEIAKRLTAGGRLIGIDRDADAQAAARERLKEFADRVTFVHDDFKNACAALDELGIEGINGVLLDLGVSSWQLDSAERGERAKAPIKTTLQLAELVAGCYPAATRHKFGHPAKRTFQAIRIEVNGELDGLSEAVTELALRLLPGGRMAVITFHSLEDRIVKNAFKQLTLSCTCPPDFPVCVCGKVKQVELVNTKPLTASAAELAVNPRAESAKLRVIERLDTKK